MNRVLLFQLSTCCLIGCCEHCSAIAEWQQWGLQGGASTTSLKCHVSLNRSIDPVACVEDREPLIPPEKVMQLPSGFEVDLSPGKFASLRVHQAALRKRSREAMWDAQTYRLQIRSG